MKYLVEIEPGVWLANWQGDPGRTLLQSSARKYKSERAAKYAIARARRYSKFEEARVVTVP